MPINVSHMYHRHKLAWQKTRRMQASPTLAIHRWERTGARPDSGVKGTLSDTGISAVECTWQTLKDDEKAMMGLTAKTKACRFVCYDLLKSGATFTAELSDVIQFPESEANAYWDIKSVETLPSGRVEIRAASQRGA